MRPLLFSLFAFAAAQAVTAGCSAPASDDSPSVVPPDDGGTADAPDLDGGATGATRDAGAARDSAQVPADAAPPPIASPIARAFADPFVLHDGPAYHLYSTKGRGKNIPHVTSADLASWSLGAEDDAMPTLPSWAAPEGIVWAPGVLKVSASRYVLFFASKRAGSAPVGEKGQMCVGRAVATSPGGPFVDVRATPLYCETARWSLDPSPFADADGTVYLLWRQDVDDPARTSTMNAVYVQQLAPAGDVFAPGTSPVELLRRTNGSWEDPIVENPAMVVSGGKRLLFYSANLWRTPDYAIGYAECASAVGPCTKRSTTGPWLGSAPSIGMTGPGGEEVIRTTGGAVDVTPAGDLLMTMHGWLGPSIAAADGGQEGIRAPWIARLSVAGVKPTVRWP